VRALLCLALGAVVFVGIGCATHGYQKAQRTSQSLTAAAQQIDLARQQLATTSATLSALVNQPTRDLKRAFEDYRSSVNALERTIKDVNNQAEIMQREGAKYFDTWNKQLAEMRSENVRARSASREQEVAQQFNAIQQQYYAVQQQFGPLLSRLHDIERLLSVDLTPTGVRTAQDFAARADGDAAKLRATLDQLAAQFRAVSGVLAPPKTTG
jgi:chromosome segregation ATPase